MDIKRRRGQRNFTQQLQEDEGSRPGWKRFTTYAKLEHIDYLKKKAVNSGQLMLEVVHDIIERDKKKHG